MKISNEVLNRLINNSNKQNKYRNKKVFVGSELFDSKKEYNRFIQLQMLEKLGKIKNLQRQVKFELQPSFKYNEKTIRAINYIADFVYEQNGERIVEDVKSEATRKDKVYLIKKKMLLYVFNIEIKEF